MGPWSSFLLRHVKRRAPVVQVPVRGVGNVLLRPGTWDARVFRQVFTSQEYELRVCGQWPAMRRSADPLEWDGVRSSSTPAPTSERLPCGSPCSSRWPRWWRSSLTPPTSGADGQRQLRGVEVGRGRRWVVGQDVDLVNEGWRVVGGVSTKRSPGGRRRADLHDPGEIVDAHRAQCELFLVKISTSRASRQISSPPTRGGWTTSWW